MKIGFAGNTNNYPLLLAIALERQGCEIVFLVDGQERLHDPHSYTSSLGAGIRLINYPNPIKNFYSLFWWNNDLRKISREFAGCDFLIVNGLWPSFARKMNKPYFCLLTGSDLEYYGDSKKFTKDIWKSSSSERLIRRLIKLSIAFVFSFFHLWSIKKSIGLSYFPKGIILNGDRLLSRYKGIRLQNFMADVRRIKPFSSEFDGTLRVLMGSRHSWTQTPTQLSLDNKRNDIFFVGAAKFLKENKTKLKIHLVKKGPDYQKSEQLIRELGIEEYVEWFDEMSLVEFLEHIKASHVVVDQLGDGSFGMVALDAMAFGKPVLTNVNMSVWKDHIDESLPFCQASSAEDVCNQLVVLSNDETRESIGFESRKFVEKYFSSDAMALKILELFSNA